MIDGAALGKAADVICTALEGCQTVVRQAESFAGTDLLPTDIFFLGCEAPQPTSFSYLDQMLRHINLSGRCCGVFSANKKALKYLSKLVKDSGVSLGKPLLIKDTAATTEIIKKWTQDILNKLP